MPAPAKQPPRVWLIAHIDARRTAPTALLRDAGFDVTPYSLPEHALAALEDGAAPPDLIITGLHSPGLGGVRFCRLVRTATYRSLNETPLLAVSATYAGIDPGYLARALGANAFLPLPDADDVWLRLVDDLLAGRLPIQRPRALLADPGGERLGRWHDTLVLLGYETQQMQSLGALEAVPTAGAPDLILATEAALGKGGRATVERLREELPDCAIVVVRQRDSGSHAAHWLASGADLVLREPVDALHLAQSAEVARLDRFARRVSDLLLARSEALARTGQRYQRIVETAYEGIWEMDAQGITTFVNRRMAEMLGYAPEELVGMPVLALLPEEERGGFEASLEARRRGERGVYERRQIRKDGSELWVRLSATPRFASDGTFEGCFAMVSDITERKRAEEALRESEERHRRISTLMSDYAYAFIVHPDGTLEREWVAGDFEGITGWSTRDLDARGGWMALIYPRDMPIALARRDRLLAGREDVSEFRIVRSDGEVRWLRDHGYPEWHAAEQRVVRIYGGASDITERKRAEEALRESELKFRSLVDQAAEAMFLHDLEGRIVDVNRAASQQTRYSRDELLRMSVFDIDCDPGKRDALLAAWHALQPATFPLTVHTQHTRKDGTRYPVEVTLSRVQFGDQDLILALARDITERVQAEEALARERALLRTVIDTLPLAVYAKDAEGRKILTNRVDLAWIGAASEDEVLGKTDIEAYRDDRGEEYAADDAYVYATGQPILDDERLAHDAQGNPRWTWGSKVPLVDAHGKVYGIVGVAQDITDRKMAQEALRESEERYRQVFEGSRDGMVMVTPTGRITDANRAYCEMLGYTLDELKALKDFYAITPERWHRWEAEEIWQKRLLTQGYSGVYEKEYVRKDGTVFPVELHAYAVFGPDGEPRYLWAVVRDITERKRAEEALRESELKFRSLVDQAAEAMFLHDLEGRIVDVNRAAVVQTGYSREELLRMRVADIDPEAETRNDKRNCWDALTRGGEPLRFTVQHRRKDGSTYPAEVTISRVEYAGDAYVLALARDITERVQAEEALAHERLLLRTVIDNLPHAIYAKDLQGRKILTNPADLANIGAACAGDVLGKTDRELFPAETAACSEADDRTVLETGQPVLNREDELVNAQGEHKWLLSSKLPLRDEQGALLGLVGIGLDITERKQMELALRQSEERYRRIVETTNDGIWQVDTEGNTLYVNRRMAEMLGYTPEEMLGRNTTEFIHPEELDDHLARVRARRNWHTPDSYERRLVRKDGSVIWVRISASAMKTPEGVYQGALGMVSDITQRRQAEEALARERALLRIVIDNLPSSVYAKDLEGRKTLANRANWTALGASSEVEVLGRTDAAFYPPEIAAQFAKADRHVLETGQPILNVERQMVGRDGQPRWLLTSKLPLRDEQGNVIGLVGITHDISQQKRMEEERLEMERQLMHAQKLESLGVLAGGIAHDFNNLLMAILGNLDLALLDLPPLSPARDSIVQAIQAGRRAADVARQMLAYSGRGRFVVQPVNLSALVEENARMLRAALAGGVSLHLELDGKLPSVEADPGQIQQVILNLITNASEAIQGAGVVRLTTGVRECDAAYLARSLLPTKPAPGRYVYLEVTDTGSGMSRETLTRIFEPFFTTKATGRGLGMAVVQGIVTGHKGAILMQSAPGKGTTVRVLFPALPQAEAQESQADDAQGDDAVLGQHAVIAPAKGITVLVVDDEDMVRRLAQTMLERAGYHVLAAKDGEEALQTYRAHADEIRCVLLDLTMPRMDGMATLRALHGLNPELPVLLSSGYSMYETAKNVGKARLAGFVQKPYTLKGLLEALEGALADKDAGK